MKNRNMQQSQEEKEEKKNDMPPTTGISFLTALYMCYEFAKQICIRYLIFPERHVFRLLFLQYIMLVTVQDIFNPSNTPETFSLCEKFKLLLFYIGYVWVYTIFCCVFAMKSKGLIEVADDPEKKEYAFTKFNTSEFILSRTNGRFPGITHFFYLTILAFVTWFIEMPVVAYYAIALYFLVGYLQITKKPYYYNWLLNVFYDLYLVYPDDENNRFFLYVKRGELDTGKNTIKFTKKRKLNRNTYILD